MWFERFPNNIFPEQMMQAGIHFVSAAGNDAMDTARIFPQAKGIIQVGALNEDDRPTAWTNRGDSIAVWAPGENVLAAWIGMDDARIPIMGTR